MNTDGIPSQHATLSDSHALLQLFLPTAVRAGCCYVRSVCVPEGDQARTLASVSLGERRTEPAGPIPPQGDSEEVGLSPTECWLLGLTLPSLQAVQGELRSF